MEARDSLVQKELAQAAHMHVETAINEQQLELLKLDVQIRQENYNFEKAKSFHNQFYLFAEAVDLRNVTNCIGELGVWDRLEPTCDIEIAFHSPGGAVLPGMALFDFISRLKRTHRITTSVLGFSASMAAILLQAGSHRIVGGETSIMLHELTGGAVGRIADIEDTTAFLRKIQDRVINLFLERSGGRIDRDTFLQNWKREWWLNAEEMVRWGFADEVV